MTCAIFTRLLLSALLLLPLTGASQNHQFSFTQYNIKEGLAGSVVHGICQDRDGFLWFATETGLSRFDGKHFKNFTTADGLPGNEVIGVIPDGENRIWIQVFKNAAAYYYKGKIYNAANNTILGRLQLTDILREQGTDTAGRLCFRMGGVILTLTPTGNLLKKDTLLTFDQAKQYNIDSLAAEMRKDKSDFFRYNSWWMRHKRNAAIQVHKNLTGDIIMLLKGSLFICIAGQPVYQMRTPKGFDNLLTLNAGTIILKLHTGGGLLLDIHNPKQLLHCLSEEQINLVWADSEGNFWFSTNGSGIYKLSSLAVKNYRLFQQKLPRQVINISKWREKIYAGTNNGQFWQITRGAASLQPVPKDFFSPDQVHHQGTIESLLLPGRVFNPYQQIYQNNSFLKKYKLNNLAIKTLSASSNGTLVASGAKVISFSQKRLKPPDTIRMGRSTCALEAGRQYFIGTLEGLYILDSNKKSFFAGNVHPALKSRIGSLGMSQNGTVWITSYSDGVIGWKDGKVTAHITEADGLSSNNCRSVFIDSSRIWIGTEKGLNKVDIAGDKPRVVEKFSTADGLASDMINTVYADGHTIYAGTSAGLSVFDETKLEHTSVCRLSITGIYVSGKTVEAGKALLQLAHADNNIRFEYAGISFRSEGKIVFRYRLRGLDTTWRTTTETVLEYPSLASGNYRLELQAVNAYGLASAVVTQSFRIKPLLAEKTWFRILCFVLAGVLVWGVFHLRVKNIRKKEQQRVEMNRRLAELEHMALRSQMNPHFIFNSLNAVYQYVMEKDIAGANKFITDFSQLIRLTFKLTELPKISIDEELKYLHTYLELEKVKYEGQFTSSFSIMPGLDTSAYFLPPMILQPYVENSIQHGVRSVAENGHINIAMLIKGEHLLCIVDDNGAGRQAVREGIRENGQHQSRGMSLTAERLSIWSRQAGLDIRVELEDKVTATGEAAGTRVTVYIPVKEALNPY